MLSFAPPRCSRPHQIEAACGVRAGALQEVTETLRDIEAGMQVVARQVALTAQGPSRPTAQRGPWSGGQLQLA